MWDGTCCQVARPAGRTASAPARCASRCIAVTIDDMQQRRLGRTGLDVSAIALGTVELGLEYGITVPGEKRCPSEEEAVALLNRALDLGVNVIDTARAYGTSETVVGRALRQRRDEFVLVSKVKTYHAEISSAPDRREAMLRSVQESLEQLQTDHLDLLMLHSSSVEEIGEPFYAETLDECRARGWTRFVGASVYGVAAAKAAVVCGRFDCLQVAWNLLDRSVEEDVLTMATEAGVGLMVRSVLMRGALTNRRSHLPPALAPVREAANTLEALAREAGMSLPELAFRYILSQPGPITALVGTAWIPELEEAVHHATGAPLPDDALEAIRAVPLSDSALLDLSRWPPV